MSQKQWNAVDEFICEHFVDEDTVLSSALNASAEAGLPAIQVSPNQGKLLQLLVQTLSATRVLELGTLGGYSTLWMARALPSDGRLITLEAEPQHAAVAQANFDRAGLADRIDLRIGPALETLPQIAAEGTGPFEFAFIDADKVNTAAYFDWAVRLTRPNGLIVVDNVVRKGAVVDSESQDASVIGVREFYQSAHSDPRITLTAIQTVGAKGYDGFAVARVNTAADGAGE